MRLTTGARFELSAPVDTPAVFVIRPETGGAHATVSERWDATPAVAYHDYVDLYGNACRRTSVPAGDFRLDYEAIVDVPDALDAYEPDLREQPIGDVPDDALVYTLPSRYCLPDLLFDEAQARFGALEPGWNRVQAVCDFVHGHLRFGYGSSTATTTALDAFGSGTGVCRDYAHLAITFCRALNIPARYAFGYLPDIDVPPPYAPMDFCAWFEVLLDGRWFVFDARNNVRRRGRVTIARGRDALDVAMLTTYGNVTLANMTVIADRAQDDAPAFA